MFNIYPVYYIYHNKSKIKLFENKFSYIINFDIMQNAFSINNSSFKQIILFNNYILEYHIFL